MRTGFLGGSGFDGIITLAGHGATSALVLRTACQAFNSASRGRRSLELNLPHFSHGTAPRPRGASVVCWSVEQTKPTTSRRSLLLHCGQASAITSYSV